VGVIPTMIVFGLVFGRWWKLALIVGTVFWPLLLMWDGVYVQSSDPDVTMTGGWLGLTMGAAFLGFLNTGIGVSLHQGVLALLRRGSGLADRLSATGPDNIQD
jgi:hypothetical protein